MEPYTDMTIKLIKKGERVLFAWLGRTDLECALGNRKGVGPIADAIDALGFRQICVLWNYDYQEVAPYLEWLTNRTPDLMVQDQEAKLSSPTNYAEIYQAAVSAIENLKSAHPNAAFAFHLSPGTPAMQAVWIILGKTRYAAELVESSREGGARIADVPFDIAADFKPDKAVLSSALIERAGELARTAAFEGITGESSVMQDTIARARIAATQNFPVLIQGESGTGKELFAQAIHAASARNQGPFIPVNCGAIPANLVESELFGHEAGSFTGAHEQRTGRLEQANGGTLFLDEIGELPLADQVKLLRALQEKRILRVGGKKEIAIDIRIIAATHCDLPQMIRNGGFRSDLYYRLAVVLLSLPPLRDRGGDLVTLTHALLERINDECERVGNWDRKKISAGAINLIKKHPWYGNVRELDNTLRRAAIWSAGGTISKSELKDALSHVEAPASDILNRPFTDSFSLDKVIREVNVHYLERAMAKTHNNKSAAAQLLGISSHQTLTGKLKKYGLNQ